MSLVRGFFIWKRKGGGVRGSTRPENTGINRSHLKVHPHDNLCSSQSQAAFQAAATFSLATSRVLPAMPYRRTVGARFRFGLFRWFARRRFPAPLSVSPLWMCHSAQTQRVFSSFPGVDSNNPFQLDQPDSRSRLSIRAIGKPPAPLAERSHTQRDGSSGHSLVWPAAGRVRAFDGLQLCAGSQCRLIRFDPRSYSTLPKVAVADRQNLS